MTRSRWPRTAAPRPVDVLANDTFAPDTGETLTVTAVTEPATGGTVTLTGGVVSFTPAADFNGTTSFTYTISDGNGGTDTATVTVNVTPVNDPPDARDDNFTVAVNSRRHGRWTCSSTTRRRRTRARR